MVVDLGETRGFLVADARGRLVGRVEDPGYDGAAEIPNALSVRLTLCRWRRRLVPTDAIEVVDTRTKVIGLRCERSAIRDFL